ncbi:uncharacterized protein cubi_01403 [Cryptosporidium ubiquitum]|uniref:Uncharacterized protein n=1 Tax=Cryptosporidium ubiquitum TaxID=857276 RepID=A0A1J4MCX1_9CRYT|nr:uncharacterized protein cubi_01403 [Cryptosporidium ubiquitum]OII72070.1 hypothetical protein cubi_01403 [Cryptosporidium ubiquitum]
MFRFFKYILFANIFFISLNANCCHVETIGSNTKNSYLWETADEYFRKYEKKIISANKFLIQQKINKLKSNNDTSLISDINFAISLIDILAESLSNTSDKFLENNSYNINITSYFENQYFDFLREIDNNIEVNNLIFNNSKNQHKERILQFFQSNVNDTKFQAQQKFPPNSNYSSENNIKSYSNQNNYNGNNRNGLINTQQNTIKHSNLFGILSVTNPAFKMIVSTVLMCLGSTPYGAIAVLVVVTVYTLIEIVIKYFYNRTKNKNILNSIKRSSNMDINPNISRNIYNPMNNSVLFTDQIPNNKSFRNLMKKNNKIPKGLEGLIYNSIQNNHENNHLEKKLEFFVKNLFDYIVINKELKIKKIGFSAENITKNISGRFMNSLLDFFIYNNKTKIENNQNNVTSSNLIDEELFHHNHQQNLNDDLIPDWYKNVCTIYISFKEKNRILIERESDNWVPINNLLKPNNEYLFDLNDGIVEIDNILNIETGYKTSSFTNSSNYNENFDSKNMSMVKKNEYNILSDHNNFLGHHNNTENKWYDRMIKYSIQSYRQNGIRGVITMILDIFSAIFSATPIGYLLITLIRLIAFMTDKLLLLSRSRKNQHQLTRLLLEIPEIFNEDKLSITLKEIGSIETECNKQEKMLINLYISFIRFLRNFNPGINLPTLNKEITKFIEIVKNKNNFIKEYLNNYKNPKSEYLSELRSLLYSKKFSDTNYSEDWTLNEKSEEDYETTFKKTNEIKKDVKNIEITSKVIKETKYIGKSKDNTNTAKNSFQNMIGGLKSFLLNLFKSIFGGAGELWEYIKGLLSRIIDFIKTLWDLVRGEKKKRMLIELLEELPDESVVHSNLFMDIINILREE